MPAAVRPSRRCPRTTGLAGPSASGRRQSVAAMAAEPWRTASRMRT
jgi:hypothetical protein